MAVCPNCNQEVIRFMGEMNITYRGGQLSITDFPRSKCDCNTRINISHGVIAELYANRLNKYEIRGDVSISLNLLLEEYSAGKIIDCVQKQHEIMKKINWIKEMTGLSTNESLFLKALAVLFKTIELEQSGYHLYAFKEAELPKEFNPDEAKHCQFDYKELDLHGLL